METGVHGKGGILSVGREKFFTIIVDWVRLGPRDQNQILDSKRRIRFSDGTSITLSNDHTALPRPEKISYISVRSIEVIKE